MMMWKGFRGTVWKALFAANVWVLALAVTPVTARPPGGDEPPDIAEGMRALYRGDYERARSLASKHLEAHPEDPPARILLARAELAEGQYDPAYETLQKALALDPANIDALYYLERLCTILSQIEFRRLLETAPDSFRAHQLMAESYSARHDDDEAEKEYQAALKANPTSVEILDALGELKRSKFKFDEALDYYTRALKLAPRDYTSAYGSGACYLYKQNPSRAIQSLRRALEVDPNSAAAHLALGDALLRGGDAAAAVAELNAAITLVPGMRQAYTLLARAYQKLGQTRKAQQALQKEQQLAQEEVKARETTLDSNDAIPPAKPQQPPAGEPPTREPRRPE